MQSYLQETLYALIVFVVLGMLLQLFERVANKPVGGPKARAEFFSDITFGLFGILLAPLCYMANSWLVTQLLGNIIAQQPLSDLISQAPLWAQFAIALVLMDFIVYIRHRFTHRYLWPIHTIHHSVETVQWSTRYRLHPFDVYISSLFYVLIFYMLGFTGTAIVWASLAVIAVDLWNHLNIDIQFRGAWKWIISSPNYHKWHHATAREAAGKNFVVVFPWIDKLFGSYYYPSSAPKQMGVLNEKGKRALAPNVVSELLYPLQPRK